MTMPVDLILVRHGESEGNLAMRLARAGDESAHSPEFMARPSARYRLTDKGISQAQAAGEWLRKEFPNGFERWYVSEYERAKETASLLGYENAEWFVDYHLREREWGLFDHMPLSQREREYADNLAFQEIEPFYWSPPGGESLAQLSLRLNRVLGTLHRECSEGQGLVVCHGEVMWTFRVMLERMSSEQFRTLHKERAPLTRMRNCQILHYTRQDPHTSKVGSYYSHMRSICPWDTTKSPNEWEEIDRKVYSSEDLAKEVQRFPRLLSDS